MEVGLVALQDALQGELAHTQHLKVPLHDAPAPRSAVLVLEQPQVQDLTHPENTEGEEVVSGFVSSVCARFTLAFNKSAVTLTVLSRLDPTKLQIF